MCQRKKERKAGKGKNKKIKGNFEKLEEAIFFFLCF